MASMRASARNFLEPRRPRARAAPSRARARPASRVHDPHCVAARAQRAHHVAADEAGGAGDQHAARALMSRPPSRRSARSGRTSRRTAGCVTVMVKRNQPWPRSMCSTCVTPGEKQRGSQQPASPSRDRSSSRGSRNAARRRLRTRRSGMHSRAGSLLDEHAVGGRPPWWSARGAACRRPSGIRGSRRRRAASGRTMHARRDVVADARRHRRAEQRAEPGEQRGRARSRARLRTRRRR